MNDRPGHSPTGGHHPPPSPARRRPLATVLGITCAIMIAEIAGALLSGSLALLADAGHVLTDVAGLSLALVAAVLAARPATAAYTWGYQRAEVLAGAAQAAVLLTVGGLILIEAVRRLVAPPGVVTGPMILFGAVGLVGNAVAAAVLFRSGDRNLNTRAATLEVLNDALGSVAVLVAAGVIALTGWTRADGIASLLIGLLILPRTWRLLRESVDVLLEATPKGIDLAAVRAHIRELPGVRAVHDLHASTVASDLPVLTAHVVVDDCCFRAGQLPRLLDQLQDCLAGHFDVRHSTFQFEPAGHADHEGSSHA
ncbi:cation diffusion facilitator family transporter [Rhizomonospora bruguierae]|uniref:cation diffusion facilitator family transporter n=1 Tax=Rhizomonospora bruguierae TaxID=1581705 RepID=UPI001BCBBDA4|nr:cation diffusion facilitator family transporter [Micromonospora sp. NBRC 107566]